MIRILARKLPLLVLTLCIAAGAVSLESFGLHHYANHHQFHHCAGDHVRVSVTRGGGAPLAHAESECPVCLQIEAARNLLKTARPIKQAAVPVFPANCAHGHIAQYGCSSVFIPLPVDLKVKINT
jgi:hypothetical protein